MEIARFRRLCRYALAAGVVVMAAGIGVYILGMEAAGVALLIAGMVVALLFYSCTRLFSVYDYQHMMDRRDPAEQIRKK